MENLLRNFNADFHTKEAIKEYFTKVIEDEAIRRMYAREDVSHIGDAKALLDLAFSSLEERFSIRNIKNIKKDEDTILSQNK